MDEHQFIECLIHYGLTRQEAIVYHRLLTDGKQTGYEIAKATGISRSNAYSALAALTEKGASVVPILQSICQWAGAFYKDGGDTPLVQCQKCDHRR